MNNREAGNPMINRFVKPLLLLLLVAYARNGYPADTEAAKAKYETGVTLFEEENYPAALTAFEDSYNIVSKVSVLYSIGMCQKALFRFTDALTTFRKYLEEGGEKKKSWKRRNVEAAIMEMNKLVGTLAVTDAPEGADISIDGSSVGKSPLGAPMVLNPGQHKVQVIKKGFDPMETTVTIASEAEMTIRAALEPAKGTLSVICDLDTAVVMLDGNHMGGCASEGATLPGTHEVTVMAPGMRTVTRQVTVAPGEHTSVSVSLMPKPLEPDLKPVAQTTVSKPVPELRPAEPKRRHPGLVATGAVALTLGAGLGVVGAFFNVEASQDYNAGKKAENAMTPGTDLNDTEYKALENNYSTANDELDVDNALMFAGYAAGGALIVTGIVLLVVGSKKVRPVEAPPVSMTGSRLSVRF